MMISKTAAFLLFGFVAMINAYPTIDLADDEVYPYVLQEFVDRNTANPRVARAVYFALQEIEDPAYLSSAPRHRRSLQPGGPQVPQQTQDGWVLNPSINRDKKGNTNTNVEVHRTSQDYDFNAGWGKVVDGPGKAKPTWHADATIRW